MELTLCGGGGSIPGGHVTLHVCCLSQKLKVLKLYDNTCRSTFLTNSYPWETCSNHQWPGSRPITLSWEITRGTSLPGMLNSHSSCGLKDALRQRKTNIIWCCLYVDFKKNGTNELNLPESQMQKTKLMVTGGKEGGINWNIEIDTYALLYIK